MCFAFCGIDVQHDPFSRGGGSRRGTGLTVEKPSTDSAATGSLHEIGVKAERKNGLHRLHGQGSSMLRFRKMYRRRIDLVLLGLVLVFSFACAPRLSYFRQAEGHATLRDVERQLGPPMIKRPLPHGEAWVYPVCTRIRCLDYQLAFDEAGILRNWRPR